jgi:hypothetical protein
MQRSQRQICCKCNSLCRCPGAADDAISALPSLLVLQAATAERGLQDIIDELSRSATHSSSSNSSNTADSHVCVSSKGVAIQPAHVASTPAAVRLQFSNSRDSSAAEKYAREAASKAAALNADASNAQRYTMGQQVRVVNSSRCLCGLQQHMTDQTPHSLALRLQQRCVAAIRLLEAIA